MFRSGIMNLILVLAVALGFVAFNSLFIIREGNVGIVTRFGKVLRTDEAQLSVSQPGLHVTFTATVDPAAAAPLDEMGDGVKFKFSRPTERKAVFAGTSGRTGVDDPESVTRVKIRHPPQQTVDIRPLGTEVKFDDFVITHAVFIHLTFCFP